MDFVIAQELNESAPIWQRGYLTPTLKKGKKYKLTKNSLFHSYC
jgi:hypothetical protein